MYGKGGGGLDEIQRFSRSRTFLLRLRGKSGRFEVDTYLHFCNPELGKISGEKQMCSFYLHIKPISDEEAFEPAAMGPSANVNTC